MAPISVFERQLTFGGSRGAGLTISVVPHDSQALDCTIDVSVGQYAGHIAAAIRAVDMSAFLDQLTRLMESPREGQAKLESWGSELSLVITKHRQGTCAVSGHLIDHDFTCELRFEYESDQTFLQHALQELKAIVSSIPDTNSGAI